MKTFLKSCHRWWLRQTRQTVRIAVSASGDVVGIYTDAPAFVRLMEALGPTGIRRASHVEPTHDNRWTADMTPSGESVMLGPYSRREEALDAERSWLEERLFGSDSDGR